MTKHHAKLSERETMRAQAILANHDTDDPQIVLSEEQLQ